MASKSGSPREHHKGASLRRESVVVDAAASDTSARLHSVRGDATLASFGKGRKIVAHCCNTQGRWGKGFVLAVTARWPLVAKRYRTWHKNRSGSGNPEDPEFRLGEVQFVEVKQGRAVQVANMLGQIGVRQGGSKGPPVRYDALGAALLRVGERAAADGASVHMPRIGTGLAGGTWDLVEPLLLAMLAAHPTVDVYVYSID